MKYQKKKPERKPRQVFLPVKDGDKFTLHFLKSVSKMKHGIPGETMDKYIDKFIASGDIEPSGTVELSGSVVGWVCVRKLKITI